MTDTDQPSDAYHKALGEFVVKWAALDGSLWRLAHVLNGGDAVGIRLMMAELDAIPKHNVLYGLSRLHLSPDQQKPLHDFLKEFERLTIKRNRLVHAETFTAMDGDPNDNFTIWLKRASRDHKVTMDQVPLDQISEDITRLILAQYRLGEMVYSLSDPSRA